MWNPDLPGQRDLVESHDNTSKRLVVRAGTISGCWISTITELHLTDQPLSSLDFSCQSRPLVVMTHLHTVHAGGLHHFPKAEVLVNRRAYQLAIGWAGQVRGFLPQHWPTWFKPTLIDLVQRPLEPFPASLSLTQADDVFIVPTSRHTAAHQWAVSRANGITFFFAGDTSYTQQLMLDQQIDGVSLDAQASRHTLQRIRQVTEQTPIVYLPSHDPESARRLENKTVVIVQSNLQSAAMPAAV